jgi:hypothetical protein
MVEMSTGRYCFYRRSSTGREIFVIGITWRKGQ